MFPPVLKEMLGVEGAHESPKVRSSSTTRLRSNGKKQSRIVPRLDDSYPLANLETGRTNQVTGSRSRVNSFGFELSTDSRVETDPFSVISVTHGWEVRSENLSRETASLYSNFLHFEQQVFCEETTSKTDNVTPGNSVLSDR